MLANATFARKKTAHSKQPNLEKREANQHQQVSKRDPRPLKVPRPAELKIKATGTARQVTLGQGSRWIAMCRACMRPNQEIGNPTRCMASMARRIRKV